MRFAILFCLVISLCSCNKEADNTPSKEYIEQFETYQQKLSDGRVNYLQLCGLFKFQDSVSTMGTGLNNDFQIPAETLPIRIGTFKFNGENYEFATEGDIMFQTDKDSSASKISMTLDENGNSHQLRYDRLKWQIITRSGAPYLRVWDQENPMVERFQGYETYPLNTDYIKEAYFTYFDGERQEKVDSQLGLPTTTNFIGQVEFDHLGKTYSLDVGRNGFTMVHDATTGDDTYGGGRYVYLDLPDQDGPVTLDFNRLYNPPCSFSQFTTCLYPPAQNRLDFKVEAGEKLKRIVL